MALLKRQKALTSIFSQGPVHYGVLGIGVGTLINVADKKFLAGRLTAAGLSLGRTLNGKPLTLNVTDAATLMSTTGLDLKPRGLMTGGIVLGVKKVFEAFDYIDPPTPMLSGNTTNVTERRMKEMAENNVKREPPVQVVRVITPNTSGGVN